MESERKKGGGARAFDRSNSIKPTLSYHDVHKLDARRDAKLSSPRYKSGFGSMSSSVVRVIKNVNAIIMASSLSDCDSSSQMETADPSTRSFPIVSAIISKRDFKLELRWNQGDKLYWNLIFPKTLTESFDVIRLTILFPQGIDSPANLTLVQ